jgi:hypothetical protein
MIAMRSLSASEILEAWERGLGQSPIQRALELLSPVYPQATWDSLAGLSIGRRDAELLALREQLFGPEMAAVAACPQCGGQLDLTLNATEIRSAGPLEQEDSVAMAVAGYELRFRLPNSEDVAAAMNRSDIDGGRRRLIGRCLLSAQFEWAPVVFDELPDEALDAVSERMASADPLADIQLALACPSCSHHWRAGFDIVSFLWREIESTAGRLLRDVHTLAMAYGWHERDILSLSPARREYYLALMGT